MRLFVLFLLLLVSVPCFGQVSHPRIWLDSTTLTRLTALKNANDATWVAMKATADTYASYSSGLTGKHVITDLSVGTYSVIRDGSTILTNQVVGSDGSLEFQATGGTSFQIQQGVTNTGALSGAILSGGSIK